jgi:tetratricopeptide (TPR) repeat protein
MDRGRALWLAYLGLWAGALLAYGAVAPWAAAAFAAGLAALYGAALVLLPGPLALSRAALAFLAGAAALVLLQFLPLGALLFPDAHRWRTLHGIGGLWPGTADAFRAVHFAAQLAAAVLSALLVLRLRAAGLPGSFVVRTSLAVLGLQAAWGVLRVFLGLDWIPFYDGTRSGPEIASGTLVGRNTFAGLMGMGLALAAGLAWARFSWPPRMESGPPSWARRLEAGLGWGLLASLFATAVVLSRSRGGALSAAAGLALLPLFHRGRASGAGAALLAALGTGAFLLANPRGLLERFGAIDPFELGADERWRIVAATARAAALQPILGFGLGAHPWGFHPFQPPSMPGQIQHAHNEYVNVFFEAGLAGLALFLGGLAVFARRAWRDLRTRPSAERLPYAAAAAAVAVPLAHSFVDMDLRITAIASFFGALVGLLGSLSRRGEPRSRAAGFAAAGVALGAAGALAFGGLDTGALAEEALRSDPERAERLCRQALGLCPYEYRAARVLAAAAEARGDGESADRWFAAAADLWPAHPELQREAGFWFWGRGNAERAGRSFSRLFEQIPGAVSEVMEAIWDPARAPEEYERLLPAAPAARAAWAGFLARRGRWEEARAAFERGVPAEPEHAPAYDLFAQALGAAGQAGLEAVFRDRRLEIRSDPPAAAAAARAWARLGAYDRALERARAAARMDPLDPAGWALAAEILAARGDRLAAAEAYGEALRRAPSRGDLRARRGDLYAALGMWALAADDYREALALRPGDRGLTLALARALVAAGEAPAARRTLEGWLRAHPEDAEATRLRDGLPQK